MISFIFELDLKNKLITINELSFIQKPVMVIHLKNKNYEFISWGDPILNSSFKKSLSKNLSPEFIINNVYGHYYYILLNKQNREIIIGNSLFSILPLYYFIDQNRVIFSDNAIKLGQHLGIKKISSRFIIETVLFNYALFNNSIFEDIHLLPANFYVRISKKDIEFLKHTQIQDYFSTTPVSWRKSVNKIRDIFISNTKKYLPDEPYIHALTGGFDGRTLISAAKYYNKAFSCYCFGSNDSKDTQIAMQLASKANLPFINFELNNEYIKKSSLNCGKEFILNSSGNATFARAHYLYSAKSLAKEYQYIITGNFGSEIFRAAHIAGVVISSNLRVLFDSVDYEEGIKKVENSQEFKFLNGEYLKYDLISLNEDILKLPCYDNSLTDLTKNQKFYVFVFEEIFRKYFGAEMINQFKYIKNRTPFLDIEFLKAIFETKLAGIHSEFFEHNPFKRYKGQILYAHIIKKTYPLFGKFMTDKGYRPNDLLSPFGKLNIAKGYLRKRIKKPLPEFDPYSVNLAWKTNSEFWSNIIVPDEYFKTNELPRLDKDILFKVLSLSYLLKTI